jgi:hypothetical protein
MDEFRDGGFYGHSGNEKMKREGQISEEKGVDAAIYLDLLPKDTL